MSFNDKALSGFKWSFLDTFFRLGFAFVVSIILARLLEPRDFGLIAMTAIFGAIGSTLVDGGFGDSLIRKNGATEQDYNTIFTFNLIISIIIYVLLFFTSESIAFFFKEPLIKNIIRFSSITLVISSFSMVQTAILRKEVDFKKQAKITSLSTLIGGALSIYLAFNGFSYWALIIPSIATSALSGFLLFVMSSWKPRLTMSPDLLKEHFFFGSKIMGGSFVYMLNQNVFNVFLGKFFAPATLGYYYRADNLQKLPSTTLDNVIRHVTYPLLAKIQNEDEQLTSKYRLILKFTSLLNSTVLIGIAANAKFIVLLLFGEKWHSSVPYLQLLCFSGLFIPLISINVNILNVKGRSDLSLILTLIRLTFNFSSMVLGYFYGINIMIMAIVAALLIEYIIVAFLIQKIVSYKLVTQVMDILSGISSGLFYGLIIFLIGDYFFVESNFFNMFIMLLLNISVFVLVNELFKIDEYRYIKENALKTLFKRKRVE